MPRGGGGNLRLETQVQVPGLDIWLFSRPLGEDAAGGGVYYISSCAAGRLTRILLADVSGHGERVAHVAGQLRDLMRENIEVANHRRFVTDRMCATLAHRSHDLPPDYAEDCACLADCAAVREESTVCPLE